MTVSYKIINIYFFVNATNLSPFCTINTIITTSQEPMSKSILSNQLQSLIRTVHFTSKNKMFRFLTSYVFGSLYKVLFFPI